MKEMLISKPSSFGSTCELPLQGRGNPFMDGPDGVLQDGPAGIVAAVVETARRKQFAAIRKETAAPGTNSRFRGLKIPKLDDALLAGTSRAGSCTLILTEGDSAKALAVAGLETLGRDTYGVFPLRGKVLNVREGTTRQLRNNAELMHLCTILGLDFGNTYSDGPDDSLRYGRVMLMTDQDNDGSHIKGLVINFFQHFWPTLLKHDGGAFLQQFATPILKATRDDERVSFYSAAEYDDWRLAGDGARGSWKIQYYKGLGTSTAAEAKEYFADLTRHRQDFYWGGDADGDILDMVFNKKRAHERRAWLEASASPAAIDWDTDAVSFSDFVNKELVLFSHADNTRSLPSVVDGLKPSQRKLLYACFKRRLADEIKVAQLAGYCAEATAYHHGEASMQATIVNMAQDFVGSNNLPLLRASGQFGTRLQGGKDSASPRYIYTQPAELTRSIFPEVDDALLHYLEDEGQTVEPLFYAPILPMLLVNGAHGIGTGWSTSVPAHNPLHIVEALLARLLRDQPFEDACLEPWYRGFRGTIEPVGAGGRFVTRGVATVLSKTEVEISELPIGRWTEHYKEATLLPMADRGDVVAIKELHTSERPRFVLTLTNRAMRAAVAKGLPEFFKLSSYLNISNMNAFSADGRIEKYDSAAAVMDAFFGPRLQLYRERKDLLEADLTKQVAVLESRARFIECVQTRELDLASGEYSLGQIVDRMDELGFYARSASGENATEEKGARRRSDYAYLLDMPLSTLTTDRVESARRSRDEALTRLADLGKHDASSMWVADLGELREKLLGDAGGWGVANDGAEASTPALSSPG